MIVYNGAINEWFLDLTGPANSDKPTDPKPAPAPASKKPRRDPNRYSGRPSAAGLAQWKPTTGPCDTRGDW